MDSQPDSFAEQVFGQDGKSDINIVLLGESGVGKSTFINLFINFLKDDSFLKREYVWAPVYTKFNIKNSDPNENTNRMMVIEIGESENLNEEYRNGNVNTSATKLSMSHVMEERNGNRKIIIIDTPGINSTTTNCEENSDYSDEKNLTSILNHIGHYSYINAFIVFLKPNQEKLSCAFRTTLKKIFGQLDASAKNNVAFAFTHAAGCHFDETTTLTALERFIAEEKLDIKSTYNVFHFDSSPFKYLATKTTPNEPKEKEKTMKECWNSSLENCKRMFSYINNLQSFQTSIFISVNKTKEMIKLAVNPLVNIYTLNEENLVSLKNAYDSLAKQTGRKLIAVKGKYLTYKKLKDPCTVCTNDKCHKQVKFVEEGKEVTKKMHDPICCKNCNVPSFSHMEQGSVMLWFCNAINWLGKCKNEKCGHMRSEHVHIAHEFTKAETCFEMDTKDIQTKKIEMEEEMEIISSALAYFSRFLNHYSLLNDRGFVDNFFQKEITKSNKELNLQTRLKGDLKAEIKLPKSEKDPGIFLEGRIKECQEELAKIEKTIPQSLKKCKETSMKRHNAESLDTLKAKKKVLKHLEKKLREIKDCEGKIKEMNMLIYGLETIWRQLKVKISADEKIDLSPKSCEKMMMSLCSMKPHGKEFQNLYNDIEKAQKSKRFFLQKVYKLGRDDILKKGFYRQATENVSEYCVLNTSNI